MLPSLGLFQFTSAWTASDAGAEGRTGFGLAFWRGDWTGLVFSYRCCLEEAYQVGLGMVQYLLIWGCFMGIARGIVIVNGLSGLDDVVPRFWRGQHIIGQHIYSNHTSVRFLGVSSFWHLDPKHHPSIPSTGLLLRLGKPNSTALKQGEHLLRLAHHGHLPQFLCVGQGFEIPWEDKTPPGRLDFRWKPTEPGRYLGCRRNNAKH